MMVFVAMTGGRPAHAQAIPPEAFTKGPFTKNGTPLAVSKRLDRLEATYGKNPGSPAFRKAFQQLHNDIPYAPSTRQLLETAGKYLTLLQAAKDTNLARQYTAELGKIQIELNKNDVYRKMLNEGISRAAEASRHRSERVPIKPPQNQQGSTLPPPPSAPVVAQTYPVTAAQDWQARIQPGDILLKGPPVGGSPTQVIYANHYDHCGVYIGGQVVFDSKSLTPYHKDGVWFRDLEEWKDRGVDICILRDNKRSQYQVVQAMNAAISTYGSNGRTPYNWFYPDKTTDASLYCSQLAWKIHRKLDIDLDSNDFWYIVSIGLRWGAIAAVAGLPISGSIEAMAVAFSGVAPDEIRASEHVNVIWEGRNR